MWMRTRGVTGWLFIICPACFRVFGSLLLSSRWYLYWFLRRAWVAGAGPKTLRSFIFLSWSPSVLAVCKAAVADTDCVRTKDSLPKGG